MTKQAESVKPVDEAVAAPVKRRKLKNKLQSHVPFIRWEVGMLVLGYIERKFENKSQYGEKNNIEIKLEEPVKYISPQGEVIELKKGDSVNVGESAGLMSAMTLPVGTLVQLECTGETDMGRGRRPARDFDISFE